MKTSTPRLTFDAASDFHLRKLYRDKGVGIEAYSRSPDALSELIDAWAAREGFDPCSVGQLDVLRHIEAQQRHGKWVRLPRRRAVPRGDGRQLRFDFAGKPRSYRRLDAEQLQTLRELYEEVALAANVGADAVLYHNEVRERLIERLFERTGVRLEPLRLRWELIAMRKRGDLPTVQPRRLVRIREADASPDAGQLWLFDKEWAETAALADRSPGVLFASARHAEEQGDADDAVARYRRLLQAQGPTPLVCFNLGNALLDAGRTEAAAERFAQAIELDPAIADAWLNLGVCLESLGDDSGHTLTAEAAYREALVIDPACQDARLNLAELLDREGHTAKAAELWEAYLAAAPAGAEAEQARLRLSGLEAAL